jgi:adenylate cyclase class 2
MQFEVEHKYRVADLERLAAQLAELGAKPGEEKVQEDCYYAHPARDFATSDEALRLRRVGDANFITYKGPKVGATSKTRQELELPLERGAKALAQFGQLLEALGFRQVATVRKRRRKASLTREGREVEISLDDVEQVGTFVELELMADAAERVQAEQCLSSLAQELALDQGERRSYLELWLEERAQE